MPRIDHDHDDDSLDRDAQEPRRAGWPRRLLVGVLALCGLALGFLIPYTLYLNHQVTQKFGKLQWQVPTRVYARPLVLHTGMAMDVATLKTELAAASYRDDGTGKRPGTYRHSGGGAWRIASRGYFDVDGRIAPATVQVSLSGGTVVGLRDLARGQNLRSTRLDPARIATLYGQQQEERRLVRLDEVPELLVTGLQAVEDRDFNRHFGVDISGIARAMLVNLRNREFSQGGSTLTQLLARSGLLGIGKEQTLTRKFNEILYALLIEAHYDKRTILETFLNQVYLGQRGAQGIFGVAAASDYWFGRDLKDLTTEQMALLIGMVKGPNWYDPRRNPERATERRNFVLGEMRETGLIEDREYQRALKAPLGVSKPGTNTVANPFPAYVDVVRRQLARDYPADAIAGAGLTVMTGMAPSAQGYAEGAVARQLKAISSRNRPPLQAGLVMTDVHGGEVVAVVGSRTAGEFGFNRAIEAQRPVGSIIKPFVYLLALAQPDKWSLASWLQDTPVTVNLGRGRDWRPGNSDGRSHGTVRAIDALAHSYNQATVRIGMDVGSERIAELLRTLAGIEAQAQPSLILGATDQSPYAMAQAYQFLASGGEIQPLRAVRGVLDADGKVVKRYDKAPAPAQAGDAVAARLVSVALQQAVSNGTGKALLRDGLGGLSAAGKTGTSNDSRDSWFAGYTGDHLAVIWVGNDQNQPTGLYGATGAMRVWSDIFKRLPSAPLQVGSEGIDQRWVLQSTSTDPGCPGARPLPFVAGYAPTYVPCPAMTAPAADPAMPTDPAGELIERAGDAMRDILGWGDGRDPASRPQEPPPPPPPPQP